MEELKRNIKKHLMENIEETILLINDLDNYIYNKNLSDYLIYKMEYINEVFENNLISEVLELIDYEKFSPFHKYFRIDYNSNLISLTEDEVENFYDNELYNIIDILINCIENNGLNNIINDLYLSKDMQIILNNYYKVMIEKKKAYCIKFEINKLYLDSSFSEKTIEIINYYNNTYESDILNKYELYK